MNENLSVLVVAAIIVFGLICIFYRAYKARKIACETKSVEEEKIKVEIQNEAVVETLIPKTEEKSEKPIDTSLPPWAISLHGNALWLWWTNRTGAWKMSRKEIDECVKMLNQDQKNELLKRYKADHRELYRAIEKDKNWEKRADSYAKVIGQRIDSLFN